jgi:predicted phosphate transport protein (TIGR00153 family)
VDKVFDELKDTAFHGLDCALPEPLRDESIRVALLNFRMAEMLLISFEAMIKGEDLRDKILGIRIYEKKIDDIKLILFKDAEQVPTTSFWEGKKISDLLSGLTMISDFIEDASDHLQIINVSTR